MAAIAKFGPPLDVEQRMVIHGVRWKDYVHLRDTLEIPGLRMAFCNGTLELMSPSLAHERNKKTIARMIEFYALVRSLPLLAYGSMTFRREAAEHGAEPDECYSIGRQLHDESDAPDIALEVIQTSPLLDKLTIYLGLAVPEVWLFRDGAFELFRLEGGRYERIERSGFLPELDFALLARLAVRPDQDAALTELRELLLPSNSR
jgi:Uma2 family endonuclease